MSLSFDATFYQGHRPDVYNAFVATAGSTGLTWAQFAEQHYDTFGRFEGSDPSASFNTSYYLTTYPDVAAAGINPFTHFLQFGSLEDRVPFVNFPNIASGNFVPATYAAANPDLAAAGITSDAALYQHFVIYGQFEGRSGAPTVTTPGSSTGSTFVFTTTVGESFVGTDGDDTFSATTDVLGLGGTPAATLNAGDSADGGAGTDTFNIVATGGAGAPVPAGATTNIEIINLVTDVAGASFAAGTANAANFGGVTQLWQKGLGATQAVTGITDAVTVGFANGAALNNVATATGGTTVNIALDGAATGGTSAISEGGTAGTLTTINVNGSLSTSGTTTITSAVGTVTTVNVGLSTTEIVAITSASATTNDFSASTGGITSTGSAAVTTVLGGSGNDSFTTAATTVTSVSGNAGNDTIDVSASTGAVTVNGGTGTDTLTGAGGAVVTTFEFNTGDSTLVQATADTIAANFTSGQDKIDLNLAAGSATNFLDGGASSSFTDGLTNANTAFNGTVQYFFTDDGANGWLFVDADLDGSADYGINLTGVATMVQGDIIA